jgi:hypothetical protein
MSDTIKIDIDCVDNEVAARNLSLKGFKVLDVQEGGHCLLFEIPDTTAGKNKARRWLIAQGYEIDAYPELDADPDNDEFDCADCRIIMDNDFSVKIDEELVCEDCGEVRRRDEKHGLYPDKEDIAN